MKQKIILWLLFASFASALHAQTEKTVLFLLPFHSQNAARTDVKSVKNEADIRAISGFETIGFWEGAKMAIEDFESKKISLNIIVRDVTNKDTNKLRKILQDVENQDVDLIIGPLFYKPFIIAADFAKQHKIPIVNPFSTRSDMLDDNPYVHKLTAAEDAAPRALARVLSDKTNYNLILWGDTATLRKNDIFPTIFDAQHIDYQKVTTISSATELEKKLNKKQRNVIVTFNQKENWLLKNLQALTVKDDTTITIVGPESWLTMQNVDLNLLNRLNFNYFSDYFVDYNDERVQLFMMRFIEKYQSPPSLQRFSFQGYDITRYFLDLLAHDFKAQRVEYQPLVMTFNLQQNERGGYENHSTHLISITHFEPKSVQ